MTLMSTSILYLKNQIQVTDCKEIVNEEQRIHFTFAVQKLIRLGGFTRKIAEDYTKALLFKSSNRGIVYSPEYEKSLEYITKILQTDEVFGSYVS
jgi:hypothetical protein